MTTHEELQAPPVVDRPTRPFYWSVRRELWENRSIYIAPLIVAGVFLFGFLISNFTLAKRITRAIGTPKEHEVLAIPYSVSGFLLIVTAFLVGAFYCLDALYGERRDRSILFWKSLPVSDTTTVLAKAAIPLVVLPAIVYILIVAMHWLMLLQSSVMLLGHPKALAALWSGLHFIQLQIALLYALIAIALWHAPIYAWLLLVSAWAKRATFLWAVLPYFAISIFEKVAFNTQYFALMVGGRVTGWFPQAFIYTPKGVKSNLEPLQAITPLRFLTSPGLWLGLLFAAGCIAAAIRLRHQREPI